MGGIANVAASAVALAASVLLLSSEPGAAAATPASAQQAKPASEGAGGTLAVVDTSEGVFSIRLLPELAPGHVKYFLATARKGGYDGTTFHRVIAGGIIQGGDPLSKDPKLQARYGTGGLGVLKPEFSERPMTRGSVAAVLRPRDPNSAGTQFFVCLSDQPALTGKYTIFGEIASGMEIVDKIGQTPVEAERASRRVEIRKVTLTPASPAPNP